jgi:aspartate racemase
VLATSGTVEAGIYQKRLALRGFACRISGVAGQAEVMRAIRPAKAGQLAEATTILREQAEALVATGCRQVMMACTELSVALATVEGELGSALVDATEALACACVEAWRAGANTPALSLAVRARQAIPGGPCTRPPDVLETVFDPWPGDMS